MDVSFYYDPKLTTRNGSDIARSVINSIEEYNVSNLNKFGGILKYSKLNRIIDEADQSIISSITNLKLHRDVEPVLNQQVQYVIDIGNPIYNSGVPEESIISTGIRVLNYPQVIYLEDLPVQGKDQGTIRTFYYSQGVKIYLKTIGSVQYSKGLIILENLVITGLEGPDFKFIIKPQSNDVVSLRNEIVNIPTELVTVTPVVNNVADKYSFTSSRN